MAQTYLAVTATAPANGSTLNGDYVASVQTRPLTVVVPASLPGGAFRSAGIGKTVARHLTIRATASYEVRFKDSARYSGGKPNVSTAEALDCTQWGPWITVSETIAVYENIAITDIEFRNAPGTYRLEIIF